MAEAWTIVGVAVNIATIIDLGFKLVSAGISAHESVTGTTREIETLNTLLQDIQDTNLRLQITRSPTDGLSSYDPRFRNLANECDKLVKELSRILAKLKIRKEASFRTIESGRVAVQSWWKRKDIVAMKDRLFQVEGRLRDAIVHILSQNQHTDVMSELRALHAEGKMHQRQTQDVKSQIDNIRHKISELSTKLSGTSRDTETGVFERLKDPADRVLGGDAELEQSNSVHRGQNTINATTTVSLESFFDPMPTNQLTGNNVGYTAQLYQIRSDIIQIVTKDTNTGPGLSCSHSLALKLEAFTRERNSCVKRLKVLKSLYFPEITRRFADITNAEANTLKWLYDQSKTSFPHWLAYEHGIYWINGLAGSGKSTLMKFAAGNICTKMALKKWAGSLPLHVADHYFWHNGHSMQRSQIGLFRSLLYQILRASPGLISMVCSESEMLEFEEWEMGDLKAAFDRLCQETSLSAKFCFFIDGLDEYSGEEDELIETLRLMTSSPHIKVCASSRPWPHFANEFGQNSPTLVVQNHTLDDMKTYVTQRLFDDPDFRRLRLYDRSCDKILPEIAERAQGVWLWTFLVTHDLKRAVNRKEGAKTLRMILDSFPRKLEDYFEHIISRVEPHYREDMVRIFMMVVEAAQPLPLFVFRFLDDQDEDPTYAINTVPNSLGPFDYDDLNDAIEEARVRSDPPKNWVNQEEVRAEHLKDKDQQFKKFVGEIEIWKTRIHNRCSDLLRVTEDQDSELLLRFRVSFLHRTVADWLRENFATRMRQILSKTHTSFNTKRTLCYMMLMLLKTFPPPKKTSTGSLRRNVNDIIGLTDELLCYVYQLEQTDHRLPVNDLVDLLDDLDDTNSTHFDYARNHWTNVRDWPRDRGSDRYVEGGQCDFMALAVQCRLVRYVRHELRANAARRMGNGSTSGARSIRGQSSLPALHESRSLFDKTGRPLLDYALRPRRVTPLDLPYHLQTEDPSVDDEMVRLLVDEGADVNAKVHLYDGKTVFELFAISCYEACRTNLRPKPELMMAWYRSMRILVEKGAILSGGSYRITGDEVMTTEDLLVAVFGRDMISDLQELSLVSIASRPALGLWALRGHDLLWEMFHWILLLFWEPFIDAYTR